MHQAPGQRAAQSTGTAEKAEVRARGGAYTSPAMVDKGRDLEDPGSPAYDKKGYPMPTYQARGNAVRGTLRFRRQRVTHSRKPKPQGLTKRVQHVHKWVHMRFKCHLRFRYGSTIKPCNDSEIHFVGSLRFAQSFLSLRCRVR